MDHFDANGFRSNVGIIVARDDCTLLLGGRTRQSGWQFPQGGIQVDENPLQAMYRELHEEIGLDADQVTVLGQTEGWLHYRLPSKYIRRNSAPLCIGQRQRWFLLQLRDPDQRFDLQTTDEPEFDRWKWAHFWRPVKEVIYFKRQVYAAALAELAPLLFAEEVPPQPSWWPSDWSAEAERHPE